MLGGPEDPKGGAERTPGHEESLQVVGAEGAFFGEDERDVFWNTQFGDTRPPPGLHAFVLRGTPDVVVIRHGSPVIRMRSGAAGRRPGQFRGPDRGERGAKEDGDRDAEDDLGRELRQGAELEPHDGGQDEGGGEGRKDCPALHEAGWGKRGRGVMEMTGGVHANNRPPGVPSGLWGSMPNTTSAQPHSNTHEGLTQERARPVSDECDDC